MTKRSPLRLMLRRAIGPAVLLIVMTVFGIYAVLGPNGARAYGDIKRQLGKRDVELAALKQKRAEWQNRVNLLDPNKADPDMVDELVRKKLNVAHPDDIILPMAP
ncbi:cell division protein FtsB [Sphingomonas sp. UYAg733]